MMKSGKRQRFLHINRWQRQSIKLSVGPALALATPPDEMTGLGPFVLEEYLAGQRLVFARNPHYWRRDEDGVVLPYLDRLTVEIVRDQNAEILRARDRPDRFHDDTSPRRRLREAQPGRPRWGTATVRPRRGPGLGFLLVQPAA